MVAKDPKSNVQNGFEPNSPGRVRTACWISSATVGMAKTTFDSRAAGLNEWCALPRRRLYPTSGRGEGGCSVRPTGLFSQARDFAMRRRPPSTI